MKKFKKTFLFISLAAGLALSDTAPAATDTALQLNITGSIVNTQNCKVIIQPTVNLEEVIAHDIKTSDQAPQVLTGATSIQVNECDADSASFALSLQGTADASDTSLLANTSQEGAASNVGVGVWTYPDFKQITVGGEAHTFQKDAGVSGVGFNIIIALARPDGTKAIEPGQVSSTAQFKIDYL